MDGNIIFYILYQHPLCVFHQLDGLSNFVKSLANVTIKASQGTSPFKRFTHERLVRNCFEILFRSLYLQMTYFIHNCYR